MDLRPMAATPSAEEAAVIDAFVGAAPPPELGRGALAIRHLLLPGLHTISERFGWISPGALSHLCQRLHVPPAEAFGVASFYALFALSEQPPVTLHVCDDLACHLAGAPALCDALAKGHAPASTPHAGAQWKTSPCLGLCDRAPAALVTAAGEAPHAFAWGPVTPQSALEALGTAGIGNLASHDAAGSAAPKATAEQRLLARVGLGIADVDAYRAAGGTSALRIALDRGRDYVLRELSDSGLTGRGGAAFPTGRKWAAVAGAVGPHKYIVCNADESEPGTFKDRVLLEEDPFAIVEAMTIAGTTVGAEQGILYVRGEYPLARERLRTAIDACRARGLLGADILGRGVRFDIELRVGAGAYICGEETALFASIEGFRGEPRSKPPFPVEAGLFGRPTVVNNVETLANVLEIVAGGAAAYRALGTSGSPGTRLFCVSGCVPTPGVVEVAHGVTLGELLTRVGVKLSSVRSVLVGGAAGSFVSPRDFDMPLTLEDTRRRGATLGSGVIMVFDHQVELLPVLGRIARFFRDESCGQCVPCRVGTVRQDELLVRIRDRHRDQANPFASERVLLAELGQVMRDASICGLGQTASSAIESAAAQWDTWQQTNALEAEDAPGQGLRS